MGTGGMGKDSKKKFLTNQRNHDIMVLERERKNKKGA
jgi:hypothetical protein